MDERQDDDAFLVYDGEREIRFKGQRLGHASSYQRGKSRWAEISIYKTHGGNYIVAGVGRSTVPGEVDRRWAQVCERPHGVIEKLHMLDDDGSRYLPFTSKRALEEARAIDHDLDRAFMVEVVE